MKPAPFPALLCLLAACAAPRAAPPTSLAPITISAPRFGDSDPHEGAARAARYPVHGIDVSRYQGAIDWAAARAGGVNFVFVKATEGSDRTDPMFADHWQGAARAGVARGAYHFFYHCSSADAQANWFIAHVPRVAGALPPVLDMEWTPTSPTCRHRRAAPVIRADAARFAARLTAAYGTRPIIYTTTDFYEDNELWRLRGVDFWLRSVAAHPSDRYPGQHWAFWQYSSTGRAAGIVGDVDLNVFSGSAADWAKWLAARAQP